MINILVECPELIASVRVGILNNLKLLSDEEKCDVRFCRTMNISKKDIVWCDIFITVRGWEYTTLRIVEAAKSAKRFIIYFLDDDLLNIPKDISCSKYFDNKENKQYMKKMLKLSDVLWHTNPLIGEIYKQYTSARLVLTDICIDINDTVKNNNNDNDITNIIYAGSLDHSKILKEYISEAAIRIIEEFGDKVSFTFIGANPELNNIPQINYYSYFSNYDEYLKLMDSKQFNIGLAPIYTSQFYQCKYINKFIEYTKHGAVGIYTNCLPYTSIIKNNYNGFLCDNSVDSWYETIKKAINSQKLCRYSYENAKKTILDQFNINKITDELTKQIPEIIEYKAPVIKESKIKLNSLFIDFYIQRIKFNFRTYKLLAIPVLFYKVIRKLSLGGRKLGKRLFQRNNKR